jgi:hypothetical protein
MNIYNYTEGNTFNYNGKKYTGYYNLKDGVAYTDRYYTNASAQLQNQPNILNEFTIKEEFFNCTPLVDISLPYNEQDIMFSSNEIVNSNSINLKINRIISNFFDLYRRCSVLTNDLPNGYTNYASMTSVSGISDILLIKNFNNSNINVVSQTVSAYFIHNFDSNLTTFNLVASANIADNNSNILFSNITSIDADNNGNLYIADKGNKQIYKISINPTLNNSRVSLNNPKLISTVGDVTEPSIVRFINDRIYVYDKYSYTINIYNSKMIFITKYSNKKTFQTNIPCYIEKDINDNLYILTNTGLILKTTLLLDSTVESINTDIVLDVGEFCKKIKISYNNSNIAYISTNKNVYKLFLDRLQNKVGKFIWGTTITDLSLSNIATDDNYDYIIVYDNNRYLLFKETNNLISTLEKNYFKIYIDSDILLKDEYFNNITFNRMLYKLLYNHDLFVSFLQSKLAYKYTNYELLLDNLSVLSIGDVTSLKKEKTLDYFVGVNENVSPQVINRVFLKLLDYQKTILLGIKPNILNTKYPTTQAVSFN